MPVVAGDRDVLELDCRLSEGIGTLRFQAELEARLGAGLRPECLLDRGQMLALVPQCNLGKVAQLTRQRGLVEGPFVESYLRVLDQED